MSKSHTRTVKLKLRVVGEDKEATWRRIRQIMNDAWRAANWIASGQYLNDQWIRRLYARRKIDTSDMNAVGAVESEFFSKSGFFGTKRQATTERDIKEAFPLLPPCVTNPMNQVVVASYNKEKQNMLMGRRSLRTYRQGMPVTTTKVSIIFSVNDPGGHCVTWKLGRKERILFEIFYGRDRANNRLTVQRILDGENDYSASQIQLKDRDLFLLLPVKEPERKPDLDADLAVGVDLGVVVPAYIALSKGEARRAIGSAEDFLRTRMQMQARRRRLHRSLKATRGGKGRTVKLKALDRIEGKERNFARTYNHFVSKTVVDFAVQYHAGVIKMEMLEGYAAEEPSSFILRNWSYADLQRDVKYKAERLGIRIVKVDPFHTSQTCSQCGHYEGGQRISQSEFVCAKCGTKMNADYNAALNIARSQRIVTRKEQCEYHKHSPSKATPPAERNAVSD